MTVARLERNGRPDHCVSCRSRYPGAVTMDIVASTISRHDRKNRTNENQRNKLPRVACGCIEVTVAAPWSNRLELKNDRLQIVWENQRSAEALARRATKFSQPL